MMLIPWSILPTQETYTCKSALQSFNIINHQTFLNLQVDGKLFPKFKVKGKIPLFILDNYQLPELFSLEVQCGATPHWSSVTTGGNWSTLKKLALLDRVKLGNTLLACDQFYFNNITAQSWNQILVTVGRDVQSLCHWHPYSCSRHFFRFVWPILKECVEFEKWLQCIRVGDFDG